MLNVLISKTLEQSLMEVQEEEELAVLSAQRREYEQTRNYSLLNAQRMEAKDLRMKQE